jgi:transcriptional regulator with XRE-family HTH domain
MEDRLMIGRRIREAREAKGWTQLQLGQRYGTSHAAISDIERGVTKLGVTELQRLAGLLNKDLTFFLRPATSFQLRHAPDAKRDQRKLKDDFLRYVRSGEGKEDTDA